VAVARTPGGYVERPRPSGLADVFNDHNGAASDALSQTVKSTIDCIK